MRNNNPMATSSYPWNTPPLPPAAVGLFGRLINFSDSSWRRPGCLVRLEASTNPHVLLSLAAGPCAIARSVMGDSIEEEELTAQCDAAVSLCKGLQEKVLERMNENAAQLRVWRS